MDERETESVVVLHARCEPFQLGRDSSLFTIQVPLYDAGKCRHAAGVLRGYVLSELATDTGGKQSQRQQGGHREGDQ
jgi:hypothetical protein